MSLTKSKILSFKSHFVAHKFYLCYVAVKTPCLMSEFTVTGPHKSK